MKKKFMRIIILLAVLFLMLFCAFSGSAAVVTDGAQFYSLGDANKDHCIDIRDLVCIQTGLSTGDVLLKAAADINENGAIDTADLTAVRKHLIGMENALEPDSSLWNTEIR